MSEICPSCEFINHLFDGVVFVADGRVRWANEAAQKLFGVSDSLTGMSVRQITPEFDAILSNGERGRFHFWRQRIDPATGISRRDIFAADTYWIAESNGREGRLICRDASHVALLEKKLHNAAYKDDRTGLLTPVGFNELAKTRLAGRRRGQGMSLLLCLFLPDLPLFKAEPVVYAGILRDFAIRVRESLRVNDLAAYMSDGRFIALVSDVPTLQLAHTVASRVAALVSAPFSFRGETLRLKAQIGISILGVDGDSTEVLVPAACDQARDAIPAQDEFYAIKFANPDLQWRAEVEAFRADRLKQSVIEGAVGFDLSWFDGDEGRACLIRPLLQGYSEAEIWQVHEQQGQAAALVARLVQQAEGVAADFFVFSYPGQHDRIACNGMTLLASARAVPSGNFFSCHVGEFSGVCEQGRNFAAIWDGTTSLPVLRARGVSLLLISKFPADDLMLAEIDLAKRFFRIFQEFSGER